jgi:MlaA lipoprotein
MRRLVECGLSGSFLRSDRLALAILLMLTSGCAVATSSTTSLLSQTEQHGRPILLAEASSQIPPPGTIADSSPDEPFDPFAKSDVEGMEEYDPWEPLNTKFFEFNRQLDRWILKPVAKGYNFVVPNVVQVGVSNIFYNSRVTPRLLNNLFQGCGDRSGTVSHQYHCVDRWIFRCGPAVQSDDTGRGYRTNTRILWSQAWPLPNGPAAWTLYGSGFDRVRRGYRAQSDLLAHHSRYA